MEKLLARAHKHSLPVSDVTSQVKSTEQQRITRKSENGKSEFPEEVPNVCSSLLL
jgi:hypothetical protein